MIDTGWKEGEREGLETLLEENNFKVTAIINTHAHRDHIGNNTYFKNKYNSIIAMPAGEARICSSPINLKLFFSNQTLGDIEKYHGHLICKTDIMIEENQESLFIGDTSFKIIHTPGHSPAHICLITPDEVACLGDTLIGYEVMDSAKLPYAMILKEDIKSKEKLRDLKCSKYIISHKAICDDILKLIDDNIDFYKYRASKVYELIDTAMSMQDIMKAVSIEFHLRINTVDRYTFIERMLKPYVEYLYEIGKLKLIVEAGVLKYTK